MRKLKPREKNHGVIAAGGLLLAIFMILLLPGPPLRGEPFETRTYTTRPRIGLVLSGGGAKGIAHIGVLRVIEESGLKVDYITGTSMGSIVGGLYASGYDASKLESLVLSMDWDDVLADYVSRRSVSIDEKGEHDKYIGSFQISRKGLKLPTGYKRGQKLTSILSLLTLPVHHIDDFNELPVPFRCIATDIVTGEAFVITRGSLSEALRASMAIPSIFTPIEIDGRLLVDGGVVRNLPVSDARDMGADIVIAVDVGAPLYKKEELKSLAEIMDQSVSFLGARSTQEQRKLADILLTPDISGFSSSDFKRGRELVDLGEKTARPMLPVFQDLAKLQAGFPPPNRESPPLRDVNRLRITSVEILGLKRVSRNLVMGRLLLSPPVSITPIRLEEAVARVYASGFFERVTYRIEPAGEGNSKLILNVSETTGIFLKLGISYDSDMNAAIMGNITMRNLAGQGSSIAIDARLSEFPGARASYFIYTGLRKPGLGIGIETHYDKFLIFTYRGGYLQSSYDYQNYGADLILQAIIFNSFSLGVAVEKDLTAIRAQIAPNDPAKKNVEALNYYAFLKFDNLDRTFYPRSGLQLYGEVKLISDDLPMMKKTAKYRPFWKYSAAIKGYIPFHRRFSMFIGLNGGFIHSREPYYARYEVLTGWGIYRKRIPFIYENYTGGLNRYMGGCTPFTGLNFMQISGKHMITADIGFQIEPVSDFYIVPRGSVGRVKDRFMDLFKKRILVIDSLYGQYIPRYLNVKNDIIYGYGLTLGYNSIIGPLELSLMRGSESNRFLFHASIGYRM